MDVDVRSSATRIENKAVDAFAKWEDASLAYDVCKEFWPMQKTPEDLRSVLTLMHNDGEQDHFKKLPEVKITDDEQGILKMVDFIEHGNPLNQKAFGCTIEIKR